MYSLPSQRAQSGFSLIEIMVALTIGLMMLAGLVSLVVSTSQNYGEADKNSRQIEGGRFALDLLSHDLTHAGFYGELANPALLGLPANMPDPCSLVVANMLQALPLPIQGEDSPAITSYNCVNNHRPGTDLLVIRRAATSRPLGINELTAGRLYIQSVAAASAGAPPLKLGVAAADATDLDTFNLFRQTTDEIAAGTPALIREMRTDIYYVSRCSSSACDDDTPTLMRVELQRNGGALSWNTVPLVEGVEDMQIDYGIDTGGLGGAANNGAPNNFVTDPVSIANWSNVVSVNLNLLVRNTEATTGYNDTKAYNLGLTLGVGPDPSALDHRRHVYTSSARLKNPSMRLENN